MEAKKRHKKLDLTIRDIMTSDLGEISEIAEDYYLKIEKPIERINEILTEMYKEAEGSKEFKPVYEPIYPKGIEREFFCYKEIPFIQ